MKNKKQIITVIATGILILICVLFGFLPTYNKILQAKTELHDQQIILEKQKHQNSDLASLTSQFREIESDANRLQEAFVKKDTASVLLFIDGIESISNAISLEENLTISPLPQSESDPIQSSEILLSVTGSYTNLFRFLQALEQQPYYLTFKTLDITSASDTNFTLTVNGTIYWE